MNSDKLLKKNKAIYDSLVSRDIFFDREIILETYTEEDKVKFLSNENTRLIECVKLNRLPQQPKKEKVLQQDKKQNEKKVVDKNEEEEEEYKEEIKKFSTKINMEDIKRLFFMGEIDNFKDEVKKHELNFYEANYKYDSDKDGAPEFSATNLLKGFCKKVDKFTKHYMISFRCYKTGILNYKYESLWIFNSNDKLEDIITDFYEEFEFIKVDNDKIDEFLVKMEKKKIGDEYEIIDGKELIGEVYVH